MKLLTALILLLVFASNLGLTQPSTSPDEAAEKKYQERIKKEYIYGVYIPEDLPDAFERLNKLIDKESKDKFKSVPEDIAVKKLHFSFGRWMIYNWGFYEGSRLSHHIRELGIYHPDDMARFIITTYHRYLNKEELKIKELVETFQAKQEKEKESRKNRGTVIHKEVRKKQN